MLLTENPVSAIWRIRDLSDLVLSTSLTLIVVLLSSSAMFLQRAVQWALYAHVRGTLVHEEIGDVVEFVNL